MPRQKMINTNNIRLEKIDAEVIEKKSCLGVELIINPDSAFTPDQINTLRNFYLFQASNSGDKLSRSVQNSWKGLITMLVSVAYCRYQEKVNNQIWYHINSKKFKADCSLIVDFDYTTFVPRKEITELSLKSTVAIPAQYVAKYLLNRKVYKPMLDAEQEKRFKNLLIKRPPDPKFQNVPAPKIWKPCYMSAEYTPKSIEANLKLLSNVLDIDAKKSIITTDFVKQIPQEYKDYPAIYLG